LIDALDLNWGARMSEVHVTCYSSRIELSKARSNRSCADPAIDSAMENPSILHIGLVYSAVPLAAAVSCSTPGLRLPQSDRVQRTEMGIVTSSRQHTDVAAFGPSTDIFKESSKAPRGARSSSHLIVQRCANSLESQSRDAKPRSLNSCERGLRLCR